MLFISLYPHLLYCIYYIIYTLLYYSHIFTISVPTTRSQSKPAKPKQKADTTQECRVVLSPLQKKVRFQTPSNGRGRSRGRQPPAEARAISPVGRIYPRVSSSSSSDESEPESRSRSRSRHRRSHPRYRSRYSSDSSSGSRRHRRHRSKSHRRSRHHSRGRSHSRSRSHGRRHHRRYLSSSTSSSSSYSSSGDSPDYQPKAQKKLMASKKPKAKAPIAPVRRKCNATVNSTPSPIVITGQPAKRQRSLTIDDRSSSKQPAKRQRRANSTTGKINSIFLFIMSYFF